MGLAVLVVGWAQVWRPGQISGWCRRYAWHFLHSLYAVWSHREAGAASIFPLPSPSVQLSALRGCVSVGVRR